MESWNRASVRRSMKKSAPADFLKTGRADFGSGIGNGMVLCRENNQWRIFNEADGLPFAYVTSMTEDADGTIWAGSLDDGLYRFDGTRFNVVRQKDGLSADDIQSLYCDREGNFWVGTRTGGFEPFGPAQTGGRVQCTRLDQ